MFPQKINIQKKFPHKIKQVPRINLYQKIFYKKKKLAQNAFPKKKNLCLKYFLKKYKWL